MQWEALSDGWEAGGAAFLEDFGFQSLAMGAKVPTRFQFVLVDLPVVLVVLSDHHSNLPTLPQRRQ
jgi:hypothetical protein